MKEDLRTCPVSALREALFRIVKAVKLLFEIVMSEPALLAYQSVCNILLYIQCSYVRIHVATACSFIQSIKYCLSIEKHKCVPFLIYSICIYDIMFTDEGVHAYQCSHILFINTISKHWL